MNRLGSPSVSAEADPTHLHIGVSIKNLVKVELCLYVICMKRFH